MTRKGTTIWINQDMIQRYKQLESDLKLSTYIKVAFLERLRKDEDKTDKFNI